MFSRSNERERAYCSIAATVAWCLQIYQNTWLLVTTATASHGFERLESFCVTICKRNYNFESRSVHNFSAVAVSVERRIWKFRSPVSISFCQVLLVALHRKKHKLWTGCAVVWETCDLWTVVRCFQGLTTVHIIMPQNNCCWVKHSSYCNAFSTSFRIYTKQGGARKRETMGEKKLFFFQQAFNINKKYCNVSL